MQYGIINVNKPSGVSSGFVVGKIKKMVSLPCGHMGTLDPLASGVLPVAVGNATRLFDYMLEKKKSYRAVFRFGVSSDTLDSTGAVEDAGGYVPTAEQILQILPRLTGEVDQLPPRYSAKRVNGVRSYDLARAGKEFELQPKRVIIDRITPIGQVGADSYAFDIDCGAGTYIRSIARDMAMACGTAGIMTSLVRTKSGIFDLADAVAPENLTAETVERYIRPTDEILDLPRLFGVNEKIFCGVPQVVEAEDGLYKIDRDGALYGIAQVCAHTVRIRTKLC